MNQQTEYNISISNTPLVASKGIFGLSPKNIGNPVNGVDALQSTGAVVSEVGNLSWKKGTPFGDILCYVLRKGRKRQLPKHTFGYMRIARAFTAFLHQVDTVPNVGNCKILHPLITTWCLDLIKNYKTIHADVIWIVHVPMCLGAALTLRISPPENDTQTKTRGIIWKPNAHNIVALRMSWSSDVTLVYSEGEPRFGQSGLSLRISTEENNSADSVLQPMNYVAWCWVYNIECTGFNPTTDVSKPFAPLNFSPQDAPPLKELLDLVDEIIDLTSLPPVEEQMADNNAEIGAVIDESKPMEDIAVQEDPTAAPIGPVETKEAIPTKPKKTQKTTSRGGVKPRVGAQNSRWVKFQSFSVNLNDINTDHTILISPKDFRKGGESMSQPYRAHVWCAGDEGKGYAQFIRVKITSTKPTATSATFELVDSINNSDRSFYQLGDIQEFSLQATTFSNIDKIGKIRVVNSPYIKTQDLVCALRWKLLSQNRTDDIQEIFFTVWVKPGSVRFSAPYKPKKPIAIVSPKRLFTDLSGTEKVLKICDLLEKVNLQMITNQGYCEGDEYEYSDPKELAEYEEFLSNLAKESDFDDIYNKYIAEGRSPFEAEQFALSEYTINPPASEEPETGEVALGPETREDITTNEFWTLIFSGMVPVDTITEIPLNLAAIKDLAGDGDGSLNQITQIFERFAHVIPKDGGDFGPTIGSYSIKIRLPTDEVVDLEHLALPGDMLDEVLKLRIFGKLLSMGATAITSIGGPLLNAGFHTATSVASGMINALGGGASSKDIQSESSTVPSGRIPLSRYMQFLKPNAINELEDPVFGSLLLNLRNSVASTPAVKEIKEVKVEVYIRMDSFDVERNVFDTQAIPYLSMENVTKYSISDIISVIRDCTNVQDRETASKMLHLIKTLCVSVPQAQTHFTYEELFSHGLPSPKDLEDFSSYLSNLLN